MMLTRTKRQESEPRQKRTIQLHFAATEEESLLIRERYVLSGMTSMAAFMRRMLMIGYVIHLDLSPIREMISLLRRCDNNLTQLTKRAEEIGSSYAGELAGLRARQEELWDAAGLILKKFAKIK